ncbi:ATP-binding protein [Staphylococcus equorum subsp. linens]|uniref:sensor histidine kinase n=1 Tax=Staphylococcus equorum TaxID=246432 RepID=UPI0009B9368E|nr:sensor histidine kinase [Staphylococcus equorum]PNZ07720.1 ATP-binding protein [Staphylococcus equorum subsp. linens]PTE85791.1 ATP-binding protein [Staphylococcus equorum]PTE93591.1 ATP-binding protein [Staphylococcus equorum]PTE99679.1 ATP-binding protein [Staphylococcus equorum]PTF12331.1 ATP-binding protein [Staphylococcus equorum]
MIANAIKYSNGDVNIYLKVEDAKVIVIMENDAPNLTQENVEQIFNRFYMADRSRIGYGSGLGLSIAQSYMKKMDGKICAKLENEKISIICEWDKRSE